MKEDPAIKKRLVNNGQKENSKDSKSWAGAAAAGAAGAMMGAGAMFAAQASAAPAADSPVVDDHPNAESDADVAVATEQHAAETQEVVTVEVHDQKVVVDTEVEVTDANTQEVEVVMVDDADDVQVINSEVNADYQDADVQIVGSGEVDGHLAMAVDLNGDGNADVAIIDVNDDNVVDADDVVMDAEGNMARYGDFAFDGDADDAAVDMVDDSVTAVMEEIVNDMPDDADVDYTAEAMASPENPDMAPDMPDYMNDAMMDA